jgi:hypothetical protein
MDAFIYLGGIIPGAAAKGSKSWSPYAKGGAYVGGILNGWVGGICSGWAGG